MHLTTKNGLEPCTVKSTPRKNSNRRIYFYTVADGTTYISNKPLQNGADVTKSASDAFG